MSTLNENLETDCFSITFSQRSQSHSALYLSDFIIYVPVKSFLNLKRKNSQTNN